MSYSTDFTSNPPYDYQGPQVLTASSIVNVPDPDRTFLGILRRELMAATEREKETHAALAEHQGRAGALTAERVAIERAIRAYQGGAE